MSTENPESTFENPTAPLITPGDLNAWLIGESDDLIVINKPGWVVCHPSKNGPWSSLVGACREHYGYETLHLVSRLDRETSGLVLLAKHKAAASRYQTALSKREVKKTYLAILEGELAEPVEVNQPLARDMESPVYVKVTVRHSSRAQKAMTRFRPLSSKNGYTLTEVEPLTGRKHQIRAHALWLGHRVAGDKVYGPDDTLYLEFIEQGWTARLAAALPLQRQALHCARLEFMEMREGGCFEAPLLEDMKGFLKSQEIPCAF